KAFSTELGNALKPEMTESSVSNFIRVVPPALVLTFKTTSALVSAVNDCGSSKIFTALVWPKAALASRRHSKTMEIREFISVGQNRRAGIGEQTLTGVCAEGLCRL